MSKREDKGTREVEVAGTTVTVRGLRPGPLGEVGARLIAEFFEEWLEGREAPDKKAGHLGDRR